MILGTYSKIFQEKERSTCSTCHVINLVHTSLVFKVWKNKVEALVTINGAFAQTTGYFRHSLEYVRKLGREKICVEPWSNYQTLNHSIWKPKINYLLYYYDLFDSIDWRKSNPTCKIADAQKYEHRKAFGAIRTWVYVQWCVSPYIQRDRCIETTKTIREYIERKIARNKA